VLLHGGYVFFGHHKEAASVLIGSDTIREVVTVSEQPHVNFLDNLSAKPSSINQTTRRRPVAGELIDRLALILEPDADLVAEDARTCRL